ncbi:hypothetical protein FB451DRAFT_1216136, partial [Mycena latifolia]
MWYTSTSSVTRSVHRVALPLAVSRIILCLPFWLVRVAASRWLSRHRAPSIATLPCTLLPFTKYSNAVGYSAQCTVCQRVSLTCRLPDGTRDSLTTDVFDLVSTGGVSPSPYSV